MITNPGLDSRVIIVRKAADQVVNNSIALVDSLLTFAAAANKTYMVTAHILGTSAAAADFRFKWTAPAGAVGAQIVTHYTGVAYGQLADTIIVAQQGTQQVTTVSFILVNGGTAGNVTLTWAQGTADVSDSTMHAGSSITAVRTN